MSKEFDVVVIGAGPGGYVAAIRAAQLGKKVAVVEREFLGGVCLNVGCIPSKALISAATYLYKSQNQFSEMGFSLPGQVDVDYKKLQSWKQSVCNKMSGGVKQLLTGNKVEILRGEASFVSPTEIKITGEASGNVKAKNFIIATGSRPIEIPGFKYDEDTILSSTGGLAQDRALKSLLVIGGGYIGLEIGMMISKLGTKVTVVEAGSSLLSGVVDKEIVNVLSRKLKKLGVEVILNAKAKSYKKHGDGVDLIIEVNGKEERVVGEKILVTVGRKPNSDQGNLKAAGVEVDAKGFIKADAQMRTNVKNIYAIGDIIGQPMLAHKASHEGVIAAEVIAGQNRVFDAKT
ncbi:MAG: FAD-dependent oxidoreductase, partial [Bdellovibrionales bacterium]|nr:FAD-dependent oxidoreductase [Bdellovibrionales bacterium]